MGPRWSSSVAAVGTQYGPSWATVGSWLDRSIAPVGPQRRPGWAAGSPGWTTVGRQHSPGWDAAQPLLDHSWATA
eukprot:351596-Chlamydomonas_euryale.AAC.6